MSGPFFVPASVGIYVRARGHCESSRRSARRLLGVESVQFVVADLGSLRNLAIPPEKSWS